MTQEEFAGRFGFSVNTLRHWEQGKRQPEGPTRAYLLVIDRAPKAVQKALRAALPGEGRVNQLHPPRDRADIIFLRLVRQNSTWSASAHRATTGQPPPRSSMPSPSMPPASFQRLRSSTTPARS